MHVLAATLTYFLLIGSALTLWFFYERLRNIPELDIQRGMLYRKHSKEKLKAIKAANKVLDLKKQDP